jgi:aspartate/methionine/tyrosine aminotransferase
MSTELINQTTGFRPFEYMAWAKRVEPGALYRMNVSGIPAPDPSLDLPMPSWQECLAPSGPVRGAFAAKLAALLGASGRAVTATGGASEAITVALAPFVERGRPVIVEQPAYRAMERSAAFLGGIPVRVERSEANGWRLDPDRLDALLSATGARVVGITDPHNPTGVSIDARTRAELVRVVEAHRALLAVDEIFAPFRGFNRPAVWSAHSDSVLTLGSLTKGWGLSSLRVGWVMGAPTLVARCEQVFDLLGVNPPTATLLLALASLEYARELDAHARRASLRVREVFAGTDWGRAGMVPPDDGIIGFLKMPPGWTSESATTTLRHQHGVQVVPGHFFGCDDHLRIGFAGEGIDPAEGCRLITACLNGEQ